MVKVLVGTAPGDMDARVVFSALSELGHSPFYWMTSEFCSSHELSLYASNKSGFPLHLSNNETEQRLDSFDVFWNRRTRSPSAELPKADRDREQAIREREALLHGSYYYFDTFMRCVNSFSSIQKANSKPLQLAVAQSVGLNLAETLMSNSLEEIRAFADNHQDIVFKSFTPLFWKENGKLLLFYTKKITRNDLQQGPNVRTMPQIYQRNISKSFEVRSIFMGCSSTSVKISGRGGKNVQDWRALKRADMEVTAFELPVSIQEKCISLMKTIGIEYGCFDFIVDEEGTYYFLEVNQAGQCLFLENHCPETRMLDKLCQFLVFAGDPFTFNFDHTQENLRTQSRDSHAYEQSQLELEQYKTSIFI